MENYITSEELRAIANYCETLRPLWDALVNAPREGISIECDAVSLDVYDSNGEKLGIITWADSGPAFYPGEDKTNE